jgi:hypothetical protein
MDTEVPLNREKYTGQHIIQFFLCTQPLFYHSMFFQSSVNYSNTVMLDGSS